MEQWSARQAHNLEVASSNLASATNLEDTMRPVFAFLGPLNYCRIFAYEYLALSRAKDKVYMAETEQELAKRLRGSVPKAILRFNVAEMTYEQRYDYRKQVKKHREVCKADDF